MSRFILIFSAFAMIFSMTICASNAHADIAPGSELSISIDADNPEDSNPSSNSDSDIFCVGCCAHHAANTSHGNSDLASLSKGKLLMPDTTLSVSDFIYGLKRPPKS
tara:strand:+ start:5545 stop:5865 length:321 start_codon:yes stop_codon:yes gene_type:complete